MRDSIFNMGNTLDKLNKSKAIGESNGIFTSFGDRSFSTINANS